MEDVYNNNTSQMERHNINVTSHNNSTDSYYVEPHMYVMTCIIVSIGLPLTLVAIYSLYFQVQNNNVAPIFIINLLISDIIHFCCMIVEVAKPNNRKIYQIFSYIHLFSNLPNVGFMVCIAFERYLVIAWPLWYHFRRTVKISLVVCFMVWTLPIVFVVPPYFLVNLKVSKIILAVFFLVPFPLFIFFLVGTLKALSAAISVPSDEKRRIVGMLVLVLLIYTLLFLPIIIWFLVEESIHSHIFSDLSEMLFRMSPLADLILYVFMRKGVIDKLLASLCCCRMDSGDISRSDNNMYTVSSMQAEKEGN